jgi:uncharacterized membrane protein YeiH
MNVADLNIIYILDLVGTFTFAVSGALAAAEKRFDLFGALFVGFVTAVGGGTTRDIILGLTPVFWIEDINYLLVIVTAVLFVFLFIRKAFEFPRLLLFFDAIGIGVFTLIGIEKSRAVSILPVFAILMGVLTAVMGGILRDVFSRKVPLIFKREIYATACLIGGIVFFALLFFRLDKTIIYIITMLLIISIRLVSIRFGWQLPTLTTQKEGKG